MKPKPTKFQTAIDSKAARERQRWVITQKQLKAKQGKPWRTNA